MLTKPQFLTLAFCALNFLSQSQDEQQRIGSLVAANDQFGTSCDISDSLSIVGVPGDNLGGTNEGGAYIYRFDGASWIEEAYLTASDGADNDQFGISVSIDTDVAVIGAPFADPNGAESGAVYVFRFNGTSWIEEQKITPLVPNADDNFGRDVSISNDKLLIGAPREDGSTVLNRGAAYIYSFNGTNWVEDQKLVYATASDDDFLGYSVDLDGNRAVVGAYLDDDNGVNSGAAFIYDFDGFQWNLTQKLSASNGQSGDAYGFSCSIWNDMVAIGAYSNSTVANGAGAVYIYELNGTWQETAILYASDFQVDDWFGYSVSLDSTSLAVGAFHNDDLGGESGSCYLYRNNGATWLEEFNLTASNGLLGDQFGFQVSVSGMQLGVGAPYDDNSGTNSGSVYFYPLCTFTPDQNLCLASVNLITNENELIWSKPNTTFIDSFEISRYGSSIGSVSYTSPSEYTDSQNAQYGSSEYSISTINHCSSRSVQSNIHKTIHLTGTLGGNNAHILQWDTCQGFNFSYYRIWRDTSGLGNFHLLFATLASQLTYTDNYQPINPPAYYIEVQRGSTCSSGQTSQSSVYSNIFDYQYLSGSMERTLDLQLFPNPSAGEVIVRYPDECMYRILTSDGKLLETGSFENEIVINLSSGLYLLQVETELGRATRRIVIN